MYGYYVFLWGLIKTTKKMTNTITTWKTKKNENGTFTGTCFYFKALNEINTITGNYTSPSITLWEGTYNSRQAAKYNAQKAVRAMR